MKTTLHYQVKDFVRFVLENLEKRGYVVAAGTEPMMAEMENMDDPEQVVMQVLVEERLEAVFNQLEFQKTVPAALPAPAPAPETEPEPIIKKEKAHRTVTEKEAARRLKNSERMKEFNSSKNIRTSPNDKAALAERQAMRQQVVEQRIAQAKPDLDLAVQQPAPPLAPAPVVEPDHQHNFTVYQVKTFIDPKSDFHKHHIRMCKSCGHQEDIKCLICDENELAATKETREVVAPAPAVFPTSTTSREAQPAFTR